MIKGQLTSDNPESPEFEFSGTACFVVWGNGDVQILRSVNGSPFLPLTDASGQVVTFENEDIDGVILNTDMTNTARAAKFKIVADTGLEVNYNVSWGW